MHTSCVLTAATSFRFSESSSASVMHAAREPRDTPCKDGSAEADREWDPRASTRSDRVEASGSIAAGEVLAFERDVGTETEARFRFDERDCGAAWGARRVLRVAAVESLARAGVGWKAGEVVGGGELRRFGAATVCWRVGVGASLKVCGSLAARGTRAVSIAGRLELFESAATVKCFRVATGASLGRSGVELIAGAIGAGLDVRLGCDWTASRWGRTSRVGVGASVGTGATGRRSTLRRAVSTSRFTRRVWLWGCAFGGGAIARLSIRIWGFGLGLGLAVGFGIARFAIGVGGFITGTGGGVVISIGGGGFSFATSTGFGFLGCGCGRATGSGMGGG